MSLNSEYQQFNQYHLNENKTLSVQIIHVCRFKFKYWPKTRGGFKTYIRSQFSPFYDYISNDNTEKSKQYNLRKFVSTQEDHALSNKKQQHSQYIIIDSGSS